MTTTRRLTLGSMIASLAATFLVATAAAPGTPTARAATAIEYGVVLPTPPPPVARPR